MKDKISYEKINRNFDKIRLRNCAQPDAGRLRGGAGGTKEGRYETGSSVAEFSGFGIWPEGQ